MHPQRPHATRALARLITWPARRAIREVRRWRRGHIYGLRQPPWWPERLAAWPGPRCPHDNKSVVVFVGPDRYEFAPAVLGRYTGHVYDGTLRPDTADLEDRLARLSLPIAPARALACISRFEGGFDSIQTYDRGKFSWGFIQFTAIGGLPRLLHEMKTTAPVLFHDCFVAGGIDIEHGRITIQLNGQTFKGRTAHDRLHDEPSLWTPFIRASRMRQFQDAQVKTAYEYFYAHPLNIVMRLSAGDITLGALFADNEYARAVVCDRSVNRGVGYTTLLFRRAVIRCGACTIEDAPAILACVRTMEADHARRLDTLEQKILAPR